MARTSVKENNSLDLIIKQLERNSLQKCPVVTPIVKSNLLKHLPNLIQSANDDQYTVLNKL